MTRRAIALSMLALTLGLTGCGRKNLPVAPRPVTSPIGQDPNDNQPASVQSFQRSARVTTPDGDLAVAPAEIRKNQGVTKKPFLLDGLLN